MILPAQIIRKLCLPAAHGSRALPMISPFFERGVINGRSFGLSGAGYDVRIRETIWLWPFWGRLASTIESFAIPTDIISRVCDKSSWARKFVTVQNTVVEAGWRGVLTLELTNHRPWPVRIKAGSPIAQMLFERLEEPTEAAYHGKYQDQEPGPQKARYEAA